MTGHCPNCHLDLVAGKCRECGYVNTFEWTCPDCGVLLVSVQNPPAFCPVCKDKLNAEKAEAERLYWKEKADGLRSISDDIVAKILADNAGKES